MNNFDLVTPLRTGPTQVLDWLFVAGENDLDECIYGKVITKEDLENDQIPFNSLVDVWIDFRNISPWNRKVIIPPHILYIHMPFQDGDAKSAEKIFPVAKQILMNAKNSNHKALVSCHQGASRSATLALWCMADEMGYEKAYITLKMLRRQFAPHDNFTPFITKYIQNK